VPVATVPFLSDASPWATTAGNKFREASRSTENLTTKLLAEGLTALTEALQELDAKLENVEKQMRSTRADEARRAWRAHTSGGDSITDR
jgi:hypothetical protein